MTSLTDQSLKAGLTLTHCNTAMGNSRRKADNRQRHSFKQMFSEVFHSGDGHFQDGDGSNRWTLLCLGLLNLILLIVAVVLGINCANVKEGSIQVSHSAAVQLIDELNYLQSNHSDVITTEEEAKAELQRAFKNHEQLKDEIQKAKNISDDYQRQMEALRVDKANLQSNVSALERTCGRCLPGWIILNTTCYFFSYLESSTVMKDWPDSRADCVSRGGDLVVIDNQEEQKFLSNNIQFMKATKNWWENGFWIGLSDTNSEGTWVWINNVTEVEQRYWMDGEPNDLGAHGEDCGVAVYSNFNPWKTRFDGNCHRKRIHWICEMPSK